MILNQGVFKRNIYISFWAVKKPPNSLCMYPLNNNLLSMNVYPDLTQRQCVRGNSASNIDMAPIMGFDSVGGKETTKMDKNKDL